MNPQDSTIQNLLKKTMHIPLTNCLVWLRSKDKDGYGRTCYRGKAIKAHRLAYLKYYEESIEKMCVCHKCDNPSCINPTHLFLGTNKENMQDKIKKGRARNQNTIKTHCKRGHEFTKENTFIEEYKGKKGRYCVSCYVSRYKSDSELRQKLRKERREHGSQESQKSSNEKS